MLKSTKKTDTCSFFKYQSICERDYSKTTQLSEQA